MRFYDAVEGKQTIAARRQWRKLKGGIKFGH